MDDLFTNSPWIVSGSKWTPSAEVDVDLIARKKEAGFEGTVEEFVGAKTAGVAAHVERA